MYVFWTEQVKVQLLKQFNITNEKVIEIELYKLRNISSMAK